MCMHCIIKWSITFITLIFLGCTYTTPNKQYLHTNNSMGMAFSSDTIFFDTIPSLSLTSTYEIRIYNISTKHPLNIKHIYLEDSKDSNYQINISGSYIPNLHPISILPQDSISIFVRAYYTETDSKKPELVTNKIILQDYNNNKDSIFLVGYRQNVRRVFHNDKYFNYWDSSMPIMVMDSIIVPEREQLFIDSGSNIIMEKSSYIRVHGSLIINGNSEAPVVISSKRKDDLITNVSYKNVSRQFRGIIFSEKSHSNRISYLRLSNGEFGLYFEDAFNRSNTIDMLNMDHSYISNFDGEGVRLSSGNYSIYDCEISNTLGPTISMYSGRYNLQRTSIANFYLWNGPRTYKALTYSDTPARVNNLNQDKSYLNIQYCLVVGSNPLLYNEIEKRYYNGEVDFNITNEGEVSISNSFMAMSTYNRNIKEMDIIRPSNNIDYSTVFVSLGTDKNGKRNYRYDFHPLPTAPFASIGIGDAPVDINGEYRGKQWPYGCYITRNTER